MKIITGIASTTHVDAHGERMTREALDGMAAQIRMRFIPNLIDHNPNEQIGVVLYGEVLELSDGEFALLVVCGIFENEEERLSYPTGAENSVWQDHVHHLDGVREQVKWRSLSHRTQSDGADHEASSFSVADSLEAYLDSTAIWTDGRVYRIKHLVASIGDLKIVIHPKDHPPAHFHVTSKQRSINARFDINTLEILDQDESSIRNRDVRKIQSFFRERPEILQKLRDEHRRMQS